VKAPVSTDSLRSAVVSWHPDSRQLASVSEKEAIVRIWDAATGSELDSIDTGQSPFVNGGHLRAVAWSPDGERLAIAGWNESIEIWDRVARRRLHVMEGYARNFAWSRDGRHMASGDTIWDTFTGRAAQTFDAHAGDIDVAGWSEDGRRFATVSQDGVRFWNPLTGREFFSLPDAKAMSWSHDRKRIATVSVDGKVRIHDASIGYQVAAELLGIDNNEREQQE
jgi:WD40 repeat protein